MKINYNGVWKSSLDSKEIRLSCIDNSDYYTLESNKINSEFTKSENVKILIGHENNANLVFQERKGRSMIILYRGDNSIIIGGVLHIRQ